MIKIKSISTFEGIYHFKLEIDKEIHNKLISFFYGLGFSGDETIKIDTPFSELSDGYIYIHKDSMKVHFFIGEQTAYMVIDSSIPQKELIMIMKKDFEFPK